MRANASISRPVVRRKDHKCLQVEAIARELGPGGMRSGVRNESAFAQSYPYRRCRLATLPVTSMLSLFLYRRAFDPLIQCCDVFVNPALDIGISLILTKV